MEKLRCYKCGKFMGEKDLLNCETRRIYDWDGIPLEDVFMHKYCDLAGGKKANASDSNCTIHGVSNPLSCDGCKYNGTTNDDLCGTCGDTYKNKAT